VKRNRDNGGGPPVRCTALLGHHMEKEGLDGKTQKNHPAPERRSEDSEGCTRPVNKPDVEDTTIGDRVRT